MALSGVRDTAETAQDIVEAALKKLFITEGDETPEAGDITTGRDALFRMIRTWAVDGVRLWLTENQTVTMVADTATYTLDPRTLDVYDVFRRTGDNDVPVQIYSREQYNALPNKAVTGQPYIAFFDRQLSSTVMSVYPVPQTGTSDVLHLASKRQIQDVTANTDNVEFPPEWSECLVYNLAVRMAPDFQVEPRSDVVSLAGELYEMLSGQDREGSVMFVPRGW